MVNSYLGKRPLYDLAHSLLEWDGFKFPSLSRCNYYAGVHAEHLCFFIGGICGRFVTFSLFSDSRIRCVEENDGFDIRYEGTLQEGWTFSHRYDIP